VRPRVRRPVRRSWRVLGAALAVALVWFAVAGPDTVGDLTGPGLVALPLDGVLLLVLLSWVGTTWVRPTAPGRVKALWTVVGVFLGVVSLIRLLDLGFGWALDRPFDPLSDWAYIGSARGLLADASTPLVAVLAPHHGKVYDPCCGSGGMFVQSEKFIEAHGGKLGDVSIYGQESNPTTWRLAAMNLAIRGIDFNLGKEPADTFIRNQHADLRADFVLANPPFNVSDWWHGSLEGDPRWVYGTPPQANANYAWLQHMLYHLKATGRAGIVLANGSMSSSQNSEGDIRRTMVDADVVEVMVALPGQLFFNTQIPACLWFLAKQKTTRQNEVLFIDARKLGTMISRVQAELTDETIERIANTVAAWRGEAGDGIGEYEDIPGYCRSVKLTEIADHGHVLTPGRYVGADEVEDDDEVFGEKMQKLTEQLGEQMAKGVELDQRIRQKLGRLGYEF